MCVSVCVCVGVGGCVCAPRYAKALPMRVMKEDRFIRHGGPQTHRFKAEQVFV